MDPYSQSAQVKQVAFQLGTVVHLHTWKGEQFFQGRSKYFAVVLKYSFRGERILRGSKFNVTGRLFSLLKREKFHCYCSVSMGCLFPQRDAYIYCENGHPGARIHVNIGIGMPIFMRIFGDAYIHLTPAFRSRVLL